MKIEGAAGAIEDGDAEDVGGQHVAGELDALEVEAKRLRQHVGQCGFADTGQVFDQQVATGEQAGKREPNLPVLAKDDATSGGNDAGHGIV